MLVLFSYYPLCAVSTPLIGVSIYLGGGPDSFGNPLWKRLSPSIGWRCIWAARYIYYTEQGIPHLESYLLSMQMDTLSIERRLLK